MKYNGLHRKFHSLYVFAITEKRSIAVELVASFPRLEEGNG